MQLDGTAHKLVLAALVEAEQLQGSLSLLADMQAQGLQADAASCDRLLMLLLLAGELRLACKVILVSFPPHVAKTSCCFAALYDYRVASQCEVPTRHVLT